MTDDEPREVDDYREELEQMLLNGEVETPISRRLLVDIIAAFDSPDMSTATLAGLITAVLAIDVNLSVINDWVKSQNGK